MSKKRRPRSSGPATGPRGTAPTNARGPSIVAAKERKPSARAMRAAARARGQRRRKFRNISALVLGVAILGSVIGVAVSSVHNSTAGDSTSAQAFVLPKLGATGKVSLTSYRGKPVVVNFFASWCTECASELPVFSHYAQNLRGKVDFVEVNTLETGDGLAFARRYDLPSSVAAVASDVGGSQGDGLYQALGGTGSMPITAFYGPQGTLLTTHVGAYDPSTLSGQLDQLYGIHAA